MRPAQAGVPVLDATGTQPGATGARGAAAKVPSATGT